jgi:cytochrome c oxidase subunit 2
MRGRNLLSRANRMGLLAAVAATMAMSGAAARAADLLGQPTPGGLGLQPAGDALRRQAADFHDHILLPVITAIALFVLALLIIVMVRFNKRANPTPAKWTHNTLLEVVWTTVPVLILAVIAVFSFRLLFAYHDMPKPDLTVKATGNQWYWSYEYPAAVGGGISFDSNLLPKDQAEAQKRPYMLAVDHPLVVPVGKTVQVLVYGSDVLHSFFIPAFGVQQTAVPGRVNSVWFHADKPGNYYGQCNELCGVKHAFMPIEVDVLSQADYDAWVAAHAKPAPAASAPAAAAQAAPSANTTAPAAPKA